MSARRPAAHGGRTDAVALSLLFVATALAMRLPHLLGGHVAIDGDEAIVGLMARDLLAGKGVPLFFYGQRYALAVLEVAPLAVAFRAFGDAPIVIKSTMLLLWAAGGVFAVRAVLRATGASAALGTALVLATQPAWLGWSMKARGGYVTAFVASAVAAWTVAGFAGRRGAEGDVPLAAALGLGACVAIVCFAQPFFVLPLLPLLVFGTPLGAWTAAAIGFAGVALPLYAASRGSTVAWDPELFGAASVAAFFALPARVATALSGVFFYTEAGTPPPVVVFAGRCFAGLLAIAVLYALATRVADGRSGTLRATALGIVLALFAVLWIRPESFAFRYLLPIAAPLSFLAGAIAARLAARTTAGARGAIAAVCALGAAVAWADRGVSFAVVPGDDVADERAATRGLIDHLRERGIANVYVLDPMYQWNLIFESDGGLHARWIQPRDRLPAISTAVDRAYAEGQPVALIGDARMERPLREGLARSGLAALRLDDVAGRHFVLEAPPIELLRALGFEFAAGPAPPAEAR